MLQWAPTSAAGAGVAGTGAVVGAMTWARRAGHTRVEFPRVIATVFGRAGPATLAAGWAVFVATGALLPLGYRAAQRWMGAKASVPIGAALGLAHGLIAASGAALLAPVHPRPRAARLATPARRRPSPRELALIVGVHVLYGAVLGFFARRSQDRSPLRSPGP